MSRRHMLARNTMLWAWDELLDGEPSRALALLRFAFLVLLRGAP